MIAHVIEDVTLVKRPTEGITTIHVRFKGGQTETLATIDRIEENFGRKPEKMLADTAHGTGHWEYVIPMAKAGIAAGADAIMVEVHPHPDKAVSDGAQSLKPKVFADLMREIKPFAHAAGKWI